MACITRVSPPADIEEFRHAVYMLLADHFSKMGAVEGRGGNTTDLHIDEGQADFKAMVAVIDLERHPRAETKLDDILGDKAEPVTDEVIQAEHEAWVAERKARKEAPARPDVLEAAALNEEEKKILGHVRSFLEHGFTAEQLARRLYVLPPKPEHGPEPELPHFDYRNDKRMFQKTRMVRSKINAFLGEAFGPKVIAVKQRIRDDGGATFRVEFAPEKPGGSSDVVAVTVRPTI